MLTQFYLSSVMQGAQSLQNGYNKLFLKNFLIVYKQ